MNAIEINTGNNSEHATVLTAFNDFVKTYVTMYESGDALENDLNTLALYNVILVQTSDNKYDIEVADWERFKDFVQTDSVSKSFFFLGWGSPLFLGRLAGIIDAFESLYTSTNPYTELRRIPHAFAALVTPFM
ncbi:MAG: hypothetical protein EXX96DRAFT_537414 [Benjaminiella poitrasii]|nr:MAG: hypothetical protein EXX96DRAFT_537414 [Benjaminiella poitrasii]